MDEIKRFEPFFGQWYLDGIIGAGSTGKVYRIFREVNGTRIWAALKHIPVPARDSDTERLRSKGLSDEAIAAYYEDAARSIEEGVSLLTSFRDNDHIVRIEDSAIIRREDGIGCDAFIRMELLTGLEELTAEGPLPADEVVRLGTDVCSAVDFLRQRGVIHREIKPGNVLRSRMGDYKLGDFGLFRVLDDPDQADVERAYGYMAPEVINGEKYGSLVDQYSLGVVMYSLLNGGCIPFTDENARSEADIERALQLRFDGEELPAPKYADDQLAYVILKACSFDPKERYQNAGEMRSALLRYQKGEQVAPEGWTPPAPRTFPEPEEEPIEGSAPLPLCPCCGAELSEDDKTCPRCGRLLKDTVADDDFPPFGEEKEPKKPRKAPRVRARRPLRAGRNAGGGQRRNRKKVIGIVAAVCALLLAGGLIAFFATRKPSNGGQTVDNNTPAPTEAQSATDAPNTDAPITAAPTAEPTAIPVFIDEPTANPETDAPTDAPTGTPSAAPSATPTASPTASPSPTPSPSPSPTPTPTPTPAPSDDPSDPVYHFSDSTFEAAFRSATGLTGEIHQSDLLKIDKLTIDSAGVSNIRDVSALKNLTTLYMRYNNISDVSPLAGLTKLTKLRLTHNRISDISPLRSLTGLTLLDLGSNSISDLSPLSSLKNLTELHLKRNSFTSIAPLAGLTKLVKLSIYENNVSDLTPLYGLSSLRTLRIMSLPVTQAQVDELQSHLPECEIEF